MAVTEAPPRHGNFRPGEHWFTPRPGFELLDYTEQRWLLLCVPVAIRKCERRRHLVAAGVIAEIIESAGVLEAPLPDGAEIPLEEPLRVDQPYTSCPLAVLARGGRLVRGHLPNLYGSPLSDEDGPERLVNALEVATGESAVMRDDRAWAWFAGLPTSEAATFASSPEARAAVQAIVVRLVTAKLAALGALGAGRFLSAIARTSTVPQWTPAAAPSGQAGFMEALALHLEALPPEDWPEVVAGILK